MEPPVTDGGSDVLPLYVLKLCAEPECQSRDGSGVYGAGASEPPTDAADVCARKGCSEARADGSRGVRITRAIDARDGDVLDAATTAASAPPTSRHQLDRHELVAARRRRSRQWRAMIRA